MVSDAPALEVIVIGAPVPRTSRETVLPAASVAITELVTVPNAVSILMALLGTTALLTRRLMVAPVPAVVLTLYLRKPHSI